MEYTAKSSEINFTWEPNALELVCKVCVDEGFDGLEGVETLEIEDDLTSEQTTVAEDREADRQDIKIDLDLSDRLHLW